MRPYPSQKLLREKFLYDPTDGFFYRRHATRNNPIGSRVGCLIKKSGYWQIDIADKKYLAHRLVWVFVHGQIDAEALIDHRNGNKADNRFQNLRLATYSQNQANAQLARTSGSGFKGVTWNKKAQRWMGIIKIAGAKKYLGLFDTAEEAHEAYRTASLKLFGDFAYAARPVDNHVSGDNPA